MNSQTNSKIKQGIALGYLALFLMVVPLSASANETRAERFEIAEPISIVPKNMHLSADEVAALLADNPNIIPLDIRSERDYESGRIANAVHVDYFSPDFEAQLASLDKDATYLVYCRSGDRSERAVELMSEAGIQQSHILGGGFRAWRATDKEVVSN